MRDSGKFRYSQRYGLTPIKRLQIDTMDQDLKNGLWNMLEIHYFNLESRLSGFGNYVRVHGSDIEGLIVKIWLEIFKKPVNEIPNFWDDLHIELMLKYRGMKWNQVFDLIEFVAQNSPSEISRRFIADCNTHLEKERSAFRFITDSICRIQSEDEISTIERAMQKSKKFHHAHTHLQKAKENLFDRKNPDYRNSAKESISAIEALAKEITKNKSTNFDSLLESLEKKTKIHPALKGAYNKLWGYASDAAGIRHSLKDGDEPLGFAEAQYIFVICSAFVNLVIEKSSND